jgi:hypothetical protein
MNNKQAIKIAIEAMRERIKKYAVDANLHDHMGADYPWAITSSEKRKELLEAIAALEDLTRAVS